MSIKIALSFDDGRIDFFTRAYPILVKYRLPATLNIITDYVDNPQDYSFKSCRNGSVSWENLIECKNNKIEIAAHGHTHQNSKDDILKCIERLTNVLGDKVYGFASPQSFYCNSNCGEILELISNGSILYARTGIQTRREGLWYSLLTLVERKTHSKHLYYLLNRRCVLDSGKNEFFSSVSVADSTTVSQIIFFINKLNDGDTVIFNFHSILEKSDAGYGAGEWYWDIHRLETLCGWLRDNKSVEVLSTEDIVRNKDVHNRKDGQ